MKIYLGSGPGIRLITYVADKGYSGSNVKRIIMNHNAQPVISPKGIYDLEESNLTIEDCYDTKLYRTGHIT